MLLPRLSRPSFWIGLGAALLVSAAPSWGGPFSYSFVTDTLPPGRWEAIQWITDREGKQYGDYTNLIFRQELEYGVTDRLQTAFYVNSQYLDASSDLGDRSTGGSGIPAGIDKKSPYENDDFTTVTAEAIFRVLDQDKAPVGVAFYLAPSFGPHQYVVEPRLLLQKNLLENKLVLAGNVTWDWNWIDDNEAWVQSMTLTISAAAGYHLTRNWLVGLEYRQQSDFSSFSSGSLQDFVFAAGPTVRYDAGRWWVKFTVLPQLPLAEALNMNQQKNVEDGVLLGSSHETVEMRLQAGFKF